jgi:hypothetical protein
MTFMDASSAELASASGIPGETPVQVATSFVKHFRRGLLEHYLNGGIQVPLNNQKVPGFFRYLVLTCAVSSDVVQTSLDTNDFRQRLGEIMDVPGGFTAVSGINDLWEKLTQWTERRRSEGLPIREVRLPNPGHMTLIGHAVKMAFPAWRDRAAFTKVLERAPKDILSHPRRLTDELIRPQNFYEIPDAIRDTLVDFRLELAAGRRLLGGHRFWVLVTRIVDDMEDSEARRISKWRLEVRFGGYDQDVPEFRLEIRSSASRDTEPEVLETGDWSSVLGRGDLPNLGSLRRDLHDGCVILQDSGGAWFADGGPLSPGRMVLLLADSNSRSRRWNLGTTWTPLGGGWASSGPVDPARLPPEARRAGEDAVRVIALEDGLRTSRVSFLGQPAFLPKVSAPLQAKLIVTPGARAIGNPTIVQGTEPRPIVSATPLDGAWRITGSEGDNRAELLVRFESASPECVSFKSLVESPDWEPDVETASGPERPLPSTARFMANESGPVDDSLSSQIAEAIYVKAGPGWAEGDLIETIAPVLPNPKMAWDVLRAYAEGGWLDVYRSTRWRGRRWLLRPPRLKSLSSDACVVDGAVAKRARDRLSSNVSRLGGILEARPGPSSFSVPVLAARGVDTVALATAMEWPMAAGGILSGSASRASWMPTDRRSVQGRTLSGVWDFARGIFVDPAIQLAQKGAHRLERWTRERGDDHDVYVIQTAGEEIVTLSRTAAVLEVHRRAGIALFDFSGVSLRRCRLGGYIPLSIARSLRLLHGIGPGPTESDGRRWSYSYPCDRQSAQQLATWFGSAISGVVKGARPVFEPYASWKRNPELRRPAWGVDYRRSAL